MWNTTKYRKVFLVLDKETNEFIFRYYPSSQPKKAMFQTLKHALDAIKGDEDKYKIVAISADSMEFK